MEYIACAVDILRTRRSSTAGRGKFFRKNPFKGYCQLEEDEVPCWDVEQYTPVLHSILTDRRVERRNAICERTFTERTLLKETLRLYMQRVNSTQYDIR